MKFTLKEHYAKAKNFGKDIEDQLKNVHLVADEKYAASYLGCMEEELKANCIFNSAVLIYDSSTKHEVKCHVQVYEYCVTPGSADVCYSLHTSLNGRTENSVH